MRRELTDPPAAAVWPAGVGLGVFLPDRARDLHDLLVLAYRDGGGTVQAFEKWWPSLCNDSEYDPALCFLVARSEGTLIGAAQCWTSAFVKDLVVHPDWRRRGVATSLLLCVFGAFRRRGAMSIELKVEIGNHGARRLYESVGMVAVSG